MSYQVHILKMERKPIINNSYLIVDTSTNCAAIVDPSWELNVLENKFKELDIQDFIILITHSHYDHVSSVARLTQLYSPRVFINSKESEFYDYNCDNLTCLSHMDEISLGRTKITALLTPGHTAGSTCYLFNNDIFTGDTLFIEGCGLCDFPGGSCRDMYGSIQFLKNNLNSNVGVYPGHTYMKKPGLSFESVFNYNIYLHFTNFHSFQRFRMRGLPKNSFSFI